MNAIFLLTDTSLCFFCDDDDLHSCCTKKMAVPLSFAWFASYKCQQSKKTSVMGIPIMLLKYSTLFILVQLTAKKKHIRHFVIFRIPYAKYVDTPWTCMILKKSQLRLE